jgi:hypothetical protein
LHVSAIIQWPKIPTICAILFSPHLGLLNFLKETGFTVAASNIVTMEVAMTDFGIVHFHQGS